MTLMHPSQWKVSKFCRVMKGPIIAALYPMTSIVFSVEFVVEHRCLCLVFSGLKIPEQLSLAFHNEERRRSRKKASKYEYVLV